MIILLNISEDTNLSFAQFIATLLLNYKFLKGEGHAYLLLHHPPSPHHPVLALLFLCKVVE